MPSGVELATAWVRLVPTFEGSQSEITKGLGDVDVTEPGKKAGEKFTAGFKVGMTLLGGAVVAGITKGLVDAVGNATDLGEAGTAVGEIFGSSFGNIDKWAEGAATAIGQSHLEALNAAKSFGVFGAAAGLTQEENAKFSTSLAELASDFASFHNVSPEEAIEAIGAGLRGEAEPLRKFGVLLDDASLKAKAMELGIYEGNGTLTQQQKILAANALITEQAGAAQGDFARTSDGAANKQRILNASLTNLSATVGEALMPVLQSILDILQPITDWMAKNPAIVQALAIALGILAIAIGVVTVAMWALSMTPVVLLIMAIVVSIVLLIAFIILLVQNWDYVWQVIGDVFAGFIGWFMGILDAFLGWWNDLWTAVWEWIVGVWNGIVAGVTAYFNLLWMALVATGKAISDWWNGMWNGIASFFGGIWQGILSVIGGVQQAFSNVFTAIAGIVRGAFEGVVGVVRGIVNSVIDVINGIIDGINGLVGTAGAAIGINIKLGKLPRLAQGATILPRRGGTAAILAEAGKPESVVDTGLMNRALEEGLAGGGTPDTLIIVDQDGQLIGRMRVEARGEVGRNNKTAEQRARRGYRGGA